jgi:hypothetical protein
LEVEPLELLEPLFLPPLDELLEEFDTELATAFDAVIVDVAVILVNVDIKF